MEKYNDFALTPNDKIEKLSNAYNESLKNSKVDILRAVESQNSNQQTTNKENFNQSKQSVNSLIANDIANNTDDASRNIGRNISEIIDQIGSGTPSNNETNYPTEVPIAPKNNEQVENKKSLNAFNLFLMYLMLRLINCS